ncbi:aminoglycoside phosphotransferase, partial [Kitasatospora griseola]
MTYGQTISLAPARPDATAPPIGTLSPPVAHAAVAGVLRSYRTAPPSAVVPVAEGRFNPGSPIVTTDNATYLP